MTIKYSYNKLVNSITHIFGSADILLTTEDEFNNFKNLKKIKLQCPCGQSYTRENYKITSDSLCIPCTRIRAGVNRANNGDSYNNLVDFLVIQRFELHTTRSEFESALAHFRATNVKFNIQYTCDKNHINVLEFCTFVTKKSKFIKGISNICYTCNKLKKKCEETTSSVSNISNTPKPTISETNPNPDIQQLRTLSNTPKTTISDIKRLRNYQMVKDVLLSEECILIEFKNISTCISYTCKCGYSYSRYFKDFCSNKRSKCRYCNIQRIETDDDCKYIDDVIDIDTKEIWKRIPGGWISSFGNAKTYNNDLLVLSTDFRYYLNKRHQKAARLVAIAFEIKDYLDLYNTQSTSVGHYDNNSTNNRVENLYVQYKSDTSKKTYQKRKSSDISDITCNKRREVSQYDLCDNFIAKFRSILDASKHTGIPEQQIRSLVNNRGVYKDRRFNWKLSTQPI
jgi:hypothetical protein